MKRPIFSYMFLILATGVSLSACDPNISDSLANEAICEPLSLDKVGLMDLRAKGFSIENEDERNAFAKELLPCLGHSDPDLRDKIAYEGFVELLRGNTLKLEVIQFLKSDLINTLVQEPGHLSGFEKPFAALALSEIARVDRVNQTFSTEEREGLVQTAKTYLSSVRDYRGFDTKEGWRHGVAHGADLLMQLSLNQALSDSQRSVVREAVASQIIANDEHFYIYGEPQRLSRPILFLAAQGAFTQEDWSGWFSDLALKSAPEGGWNNAYASRDGLARLHNLKAFMNSIYISAVNSGNENIKGLAEPALSILKVLP